MAQLELENVSKSFGTFKAIPGLDLTVNDEEFVVLVGPSGCGKSTLLRMIAGLEEISGGRMSIGGRVVNAVAPKERDIAMVFQSYALYPHKTVRENMGFSLKLARRPKLEIDRAVDDAAEILGLMPLLDRKPKQLSGGQRQRVAMGRAIVRRPQVFLFDEPLSNLDAKLRVQMRAEIKELHARLKATTIYVTHDQIEAMTMADKIVVMRGGHVEQIGTPLDLYDRPANRFVAGFIGSPAMNFINGRIRARADSAAFVAQDGTEMPLPGAQTSYDGREVTLGLRPEHVGLSAPDMPGAIPARIVLLETTGSETIVVVELAGTRATVLVRERVTLAPGTVVGLRPLPECFHFFEPDPEAGARIEVEGLAKPTVAIPAGITGNAGPERELSR